LHTLTIFLVASQSQLAIFTAHATRPCSRFENRQRNDPQPGQGRL
jgi:hypothetical protein